MGRKKYFPQSLTGKFSIGQQIKINDGGHWPNPGTVIEIDSGRKSHQYGVTVDDFKCLWFSEAELEAVSRQPERVYEFGIGDIANADDPYYSGLPKPPLYEVKPDLFELCPNCGQPTLKSHFMNANLGQCCPDCYDNLSG